MVFLPFGNSSKLFCAFSLSIFGVLMLYLAFEMKFLFFKKTGSTADRGHDA